MPVVYEDFELPGGEPAFGARVTYTLVGTSGVGIDLAYNASMQTIVGVRKVTANSNGRTTINLEPNSTITPAGTRWRRDVISLHPGDSCGCCNGDPESEAYILVPDGAGPYAVPNILSSQPPVIVSPDVEAILQDEIDDLQDQIDNLTPGGGGGSNDDIEVYIFMGARL